MGILILLTILWIIVQLGGSLLREAEVCPIGYGRIGVPAKIKNKLSNSLFIWAVKLLARSFYLLNIVTTFDALKGAQTTLIYTDIHTFRG
ncbi:hypothetical protein [Falsiporphyromonas endometrii]|uniref:Uncharacterized protein n=1 Tax=Falsiporphyromonas endometrii TaxID=1387297 RepID=A0ABV9K5U1_9PORP